jgi:O-antigen/teichoic acid export membrane protein
MAAPAQQVRNASLYMLPLVVGNIVPILTLPIFTRILSTEDFGAWALANAYAVVLGGAAQAGLPVAYERNFFEATEVARRQPLLYSILAFCMVTFVVGGLATWLVREPLTAWLIGDLGYQDLLLWSFLATALAGLKNYYLSFLRNTEQAGAFSAYSVAERLIATVVSLLLVVWWQIGVVGLVAGQIAGTLAVLLVVAARTAALGTPSVDRRLLWPALAIGLPLLPRVLFGVVGNNIDKILIGQVASLGGVGVYSIGQRVALIGFTYMTALQNVFGPRVYAAMFSGRSEAGVEIGRYLTPFAYASILLVFGVAVFSEEVLHVLMPVDYAGAVPVIAILSVYYGIQFFSKMPQIAYAKKTYLLSVLSAVSTGASIVFGVVGIWLFGTVGAAWGALATGVTTSVLTFILGQRCFRIEWEAARMTAIFGVLAGSAFGILALRAGGVPYETLVVAKLALTALYLWLGVRFGILTRANLALLKSIVRRPSQGTASGAWR